MLLFVYGTLRRGSRHPAALRLARQSRWLGEGVATGTLCSAGAYPVLVHDGKGRVQGDILHLRCPAITLDWLDRYEGCGADDPQPHEYRRVTQLVHKGAALSRAAIYVYTCKADGMEPILSGDWLRWSAQRRVKPYDMVEHRIM